MRFGSAPPPAERPTTFSSPGETICGLSLLPAPFGLFAVAARLSCLGFEPDQGLTPAAGWLPFRRLEPTLLDGQQPNTVRTVQHRVGVSFPL